jgi:hypothetical protein
MQGQPVQRDNQPACSGAVAHHEVMQGCTIAVQLQWAMAVNAQWTAGWQRNHDGQWWQRWAMVAAMGNRRCHNWRQQQRGHNPDGRQWWSYNGWQDGSNSAMAIATNGSCSKEGNGDGDKGGKQATATATKRAMAMAMRVVGDKESNANSGKSDGKGVEGGGRSTATSVEKTSIR